VVWQSVPTILVYLGMVPPQDQELLAADPVGIAGHHGLKQLAVRESCLAELSIVVEVAARLGQD
jgi:hypothetical protein